MDKSINTAISVCIPVYNAGATIKQAIWSVLNQSFTHFELLLYLDGCTDHSEAIIDEFNDDRIRKIVVSENRGIVHARNTLVSAAKGKYLAWLDADDIALPGRLQEQYTFLEKNADVFAVASWVEVRGHKELRKVKWNVNLRLLNAWILLRNPLVQSSIMLRNSRQELVYMQEFEYLEDYELLSRLWRSGKKVALVPKFLGSYFHPNENELISKYLKYNFVGKLERIMKLNFERVGYTFEVFEIALFRDFLRNNYPLKAKDAVQVLKTLRGVEKSIKASDVTDKGAYLLLIHLQKLRLFEKCPQLRFRIALLSVFKPYKTVRAYFSRPLYLKGH